MAEATILKVKREDAVKLFLAMDFAGANRWDNDRLTKEFVTVKEVAQDEGAQLDDPNLQALLTSVVEAESVVVVDALDETDVVSPEAGSSDPGEVMKDVQPVVEEHDQRLTVQEWKEYTKTKKGPRKSRKPNKRPTRFSLGFGVVKDLTDKMSVAEIAEAADASYIESGEKRKSNMKESVWVAKIAICAGLVFGIIREEDDGYVRVG